MGSNLFIVVEKERGVFLGSYNGIALFSRNDILDSTKAYGFEDREVAIDFVTSHLPQIKDTVDYIEIPTLGDDAYVDVVDIIKAGYHEYAEDMFRNMPADDIIH